MADIKRKGDQEVNIVDPTTQEAAVVDANSSVQTSLVGTSGYKAQVTASGEVKVLTPTPTPPPGTTSKSDIQKGSMSGTEDSFYTITNGQTLFVQRLSGGAESSVGGSVIELYYDPTGTGSPLTAIEDIYANGSSDQKDLDVNYVGDGTRRILLRRRNFGGGSYEITARWEGYEQTT